MARDLNTITLHGRVGREAESRALKDGKEVVSFSIAINDIVGGKEVTTWFNVQSFSGQEFIKTYIKTGDKVLVIGRLVVNEYDKKDGTKGYSLNIVANHVEKTNFMPKSKQESPIPTVPSQEALEEFDAMTSDVFKGDDLPF